MLSALSHPVYRRLLSAHIVALLGTGLATIAIGFLAVDLAGDRAAAVLGTILGIKMVTYLVLAPLAPAVARRVGARRLMIATDIARAAVALALPFVDGITAAYLLIFVLQAASALFTPTYQAMLPRVLTSEKDYTGALALARLSYDLEALVSPSLAGLLLLVTPSSMLFLGTGIGFVASAALILSVALPRPAVTDTGRGRGSVTRGIKLMLFTPTLRATLMLQLSVAAIGPVVLVLTIPLARELLGASESQAAGVLAPFGLGSIAAALIMPTLLPRLGLRRFMLSGCTLLIAPIALLWPLLAASLPDAQTMVAIAALWFVAGFGYSATLTPIGRVVRENTRDQDLPEVFAGQFSLSHGWWIITYPLAGWGASTLGYGPTALGLVAIALGGLVAARTMWPHSAPHATQLTNDQEEARHG